MSARRPKTTKKKRPRGHELGDIVREAVRTQLETNDPPETAITLRRLVAAGYSAENALEHIAAVLLTELSDVVQSGTPYDAERYISRLKRLPELPE